ncbi:Pleckstrin homology domain-containing protein [Mycena epipterygia]|nr:Pleckstrin homology domain-containing protein [Mycena epipterygia]
MDTRRSTEDFMANLQSGDVTQGEEVEFLRTRDEAIRREKEYHESIESYKQASWLNPLEKLKKREDVRKAKRLTRQSNHSLSNLNESMHSGSDTSSICASSGSPPGSNLAVDDLQDWVYDVYGASDVEGMAADETRSDSSSSSDNDSFESLPYPQHSSNPTSVSEAHVVETEFYIGALELTQSERKYVEDLEIMQKYVDALLQTNLVDQDTIQLLLPNLARLLDFQRDLLLRFEATAMLPWNDQRWGLDFIQTEHEFDVYEPYFTNYSNALQILLDNEQNLAVLNHLIDVNDELPAFIMKPIQRLSEYPILLTSFIKASVGVDYQHSEELKLGSDAATRIVEKMRFAQLRAQKHRTVESLRTRVVDWKGHRIENFGELILNGIFNVTKSNIVREYHVFLFEKILLCCKETSIPSKEPSQGPSSLREAIGRPMRRNPPLLLKGRVFVSNVTGAVPLPPKNSTSFGIVAHFPLAIWWKAENDLESFTLDCVGQDQIRQWESEINRLIESQAAGSFKKYTGNRGHSSGSTLKFSQWARRAETPVSSNAHHSASGLVKLKVHFHENIFLLQLPPTTMYDDLVKTVGRKVRLLGPQRDDRPLKIKWKDGDGDMVLIHTNEDVQLAFEERPWGQVTLYVS